MLAGTSGSKVTVSLVWGDGAGGRQVLPIANLGASYSKFPLRFTAGGDAKDGRIEISGTGQGSFHIGAVSLMPAGNIRGFRPDTVGLLKQQRSGMWRFPGGNYLSAHEWRDAIGDPDKRPPRLDPVRGGFQPNDVGTDEFMTLMELLGVDPFISVNAGFGDAWSAAQLVEYANGAATTPMGRQRAANGHPAPYNIKWWGIGNEMYGAWQFGVMPLSQFVFKHNLFAEAMRKVDPSITILATGATPDEMAIYGLALPSVGKLIPDYGSPGDWDFGLFTRCFDPLTSCRSISTLMPGKGSIMHRASNRALSAGPTTWSRLTSRSSNGPAVRRTGCATKSRPMMSMFNAFRPSRHGESP